METKFVIVTEEGFVRKGNPGATKTSHLVRVFQSKVVAEETCRLIELHHEYEVCVVREVTARLTVELSRKFYVEEVHQDMLDDALELQAERSRKEVASFEGWGV